ncbi:hypothetical protein VB636_00780 [Paracoccus sp. APAP_BH8]|uniref:hypothetical protein n=1 Tax=Paracoccus sp. APAP_BH8 TaxID=3110237 RepID=UPI002FD7B4E3
MAPCDAIGNLPERRPKCSEVEAQLHQICVRPLIPRRSTAEINKLEAQLEAQKLVTQKQGLTLARMEESLVSIGRTLERIDRKIP